MSGAVHFNPNVSGINTRYNFEMPQATRKFVSNAVNQGNFNPNHPKIADDEGLRMLGASASAVGNRLDFQC